MDHVQYSTGSFRASRAGKTHTRGQRVFGIAFAVAMEAAIVYALMVSLGYAPPPPMPKSLEIFNVPPPDKAADPPPPVQTFDPPAIEVPIVPVIDLQYEPPVQEHAISVPPPLPVPQVPRVVTPPAPPITFTPPRAIEATHTIPEYPFVSRRLQEQGTLRLKLTIDERGLVADAILVNSSGFPRLDEAAVKWVKEHWRYTPATQGAKPVRATADAVVEFRLQ